MALYQEAKALAGGFSMKEVFQKVLIDYTKRKSPKEREKRREARRRKSATTPSRPIQITAKQSNTRTPSVAAKDRVYLHDDGQCTFVSEDGVRCPCREKLKFDHIKPYALGGESTESNLRLLCKAHNQLMAERVLGREFMERKRAGLR